MAGDFQDVAHLEDFRRSIVEGEASLPEMTQRLLLDTLGVGNRQAIEFLASQQPDLDQFQSWILATAGPPDPILLSRYQALQGEEELSSEARQFVEEIEGSDDVLNSHQMQQWDERGYVVLPKAIAREHCAEVAGAIWDKIGASADDPDSWYSAETDGIMVGLYQHPCLEYARQSSRIHKAFAQLWGTANLWCTIDQLGFNPPESADHSFRGTGLHWDASLAQPIPFATQAMLYLTDTSTDQGAFRCIPGFHHKIAAWLEALDGTPPREVDLSEGAACIPGNAGDLVIWRQDLPHGASPNRASSPRLVQYLNYYSPDLELQSEWI